MVDELGEDANAPLAGHLHGLPGSAGIDCALIILTTEVHRWPFRDGQFDGQLSARA